MGHDGWLESLRRAAGDPASLRLLLVGELPSDALQHIGDALLGVVEWEGAGLDDLLDRLVDRLRERGWDGDLDLIEALEDVSGRRPSTLQPIPVELDEAGEALTQEAGSENYLDLETGTVWLHTMTDFGVADDFDVGFSDESRWLFLEGEGSHDAYRDLERFIATVDDDTLAGRLDQAIDGRGAFRRFRAVLEDHPSEYTRWHRFDADARLAHARSWLAHAGYQARPPRRNALP